jgi:hypothetical protein
MAYITLNENDQRDLLRQNLGVGLSPAERALARAQDRPTDAGKPLPLGREVADSPVPGLFESVGTPALNSGLPRAEPSRFTLVQTTPARSPAEIAAARAAAVGPDDPYGAHAAAVRARGGALPPAGAPTGAASLPPRPTAQEMIDAASAALGQTFKPDGSINGQQSTYLPGGTQVRPPGVGASPLEAWNASHAFATSMERPPDLLSAETAYRAGLAKFDRGQQSADLRDTEAMAALNRTQANDAAVQGYFSAGHDAAIAAAARGGASAETLLNLAHLADERQRVARQDAAGFPTADQAAAVIPEGSAGQVSQTASGRYVTQFQKAPKAAPETELDRLIRGRDAAKTPEDRAHYERAIANYGAGREDRPLTAAEFAASPSLSAKYEDDYGAYREAVAAQAAKAKGKAAGIPGGGSGEAGGGQAAQPKFSPAHEGMKVRGPDGKLYQIKNGAPVPL